MRALYHTLRLLTSTRPCHYQPLMQCNMQRLQMNACRWLLAPRIFGMDKFAKAVSIQKSKFGRTAEEFKARLVERLDDPEVELITADCLCYIYLSNKDDLPNLFRVIASHEAQMVEEQEAGLPVDNQRLWEHALRICHLLGDAEAALKIYETCLLKSAKVNGVVTSLAVLLDLLYESKRYQECASIALSDVVREQNLERPLLQPLLTLGFLSSLRMDSAEGLRACGRLNDEWRKMGGSKAKYADWLFTSYCIKQGRINAALKRFEDTTSKQASIAETVINSNLKALTFIKYRKPMEAFHIIHKLQSVLDVQKKLVKSADKPQTQVVLFKDVFESLQPLATRTNHQVIMSQIRAQLSTAVHRRALSAFLVHRLSSHYVKHTGDSHSFAVFEELKASDTYSQYLDIKELEDESPPSNISQMIRQENDDMIENEVKPNRREYDKASQMQPPKKKATKMVIVNGYITFVEDNSDEAQVK